MKRLVHAAELSVLKIRFKVLSASRIALYIVGNSGRYECFCSNLKLTADWADYNYFANGDTASRCSWCERVNEITNLKAALAICCNHHNFKMEFLVGWESRRIFTAFYDELHLTVVDPFTVTGLCITVWDISQQLFL